MNKMGMWNCEFIDICPDIKKLKELQKKNQIDKDLFDQYEEVCSTNIGDWKPCLLKEEFKQQGYNKI